MPATRIRSVRKPILRVVDHGPDAPPNRHAAIVRHSDGVPMVHEVLTFEERAKLEPHEVGGNFYKEYILPGLGWLLIRYPNGHFETWDIENIAGQAERAWQEAQAGD
jgi:hypothetical protein